MMSSRRTSFCPPGKAIKRLAGCIIFTEKRTKTHILYTMSSGTPSLWFLHTKTIEKWAPQKLHGHFITFLEIVFSSTFLFISTGCSTEQGWHDHLGLALLTLSWDKNWDSHSLVNGYPSFYPRITLVAPSPGRHNTMRAVSVLLALFKTKQMAPQSLKGISRASSAVSLNALYTYDFYYSGDRCNNDFY